MMHVPMRMPSTVPPIASTDIVVGGSTAILLDTRKLLANSPRID